MNDEDVCFYPLQKHDSLQGYEDPFAEFGGVSVNRAERHAMSANHGPNARRHGHGPLLLTDMQRGTTTFYKGDGTPPVMIETSNAVAGAAMPGAGNAYRTEAIAGVEHRGDTAAYGRDGAYIKTGDSKGRDIHGGGASLADPYAAHQPLIPTLGCTRAHNTDLVALGREIERFERRHPGTPIPYERY